MGKGKIIQNKHDRSDIYETRNTEDKEIYNIINKRDKNDNRKRYSLSDVRKIFE